MQLPHSATTTPKAGSYASAIMPLPAPPYTPSYSNTRPATMEFSFIFIALLMVAAPLLLLAYNFLRPHNYIADETRRRDNIAAAHKKLAALKHASTEGQIDRDTASEYGDEIHQQLLADVNDTNTSRGKTTATPQAITGGILLIALLLLSAPVVYSQFGAPDLAGSDNTAMQNDRLSREQLEHIVTQQKKLLAENPDNGELTTAIAEGLMALERYEEAAEHYAQARTLLGDSEQLILGELRARLAANQLERAWTVAQEAEAHSPDSPYVLLLAGTVAKARGDIETALSYWYSVHAMVTDTEIQPVIERGIQELEQQLEQQQSGTTAAPTTGGTQLNIQVNIADSLQQNIRPDDTVFIFARAAQGPPLPLAVQRLRADQLPAQITLDDSMAMTPELTLSTFSTYRVIARISRSGNATATSGDLFGEQTASPGDSLTITINQQVP